MEPIAHAVEHEVEHQVDPKLNKLRWALGVNGALSVALAVVILIWPGISLYALTLGFGALATASGIVGLWAVIRGSVKEERGWLIVASLFSLAIGVAVLVWPNISALALLYVIGAYAIVFGIIMAGGAFWLPLRGEDRLLFLLTGFVSGLFGIVMFADPSDGALVVLALIAAYLLVVGVSQLVLAIGGKRIIEKRLERVFKRPEPQPSS
jgi:uncharacterized membrane protein HdeD (DUF308 family)